ncbi:MAG: selenide, water dikinase SelD, partial [Leptolyngbyaceae cyanobacterium bins.302]|nr:selenide, water dikinase SelD [Leptolyngbyaceae cyanobacterium bins.302]
SESAYSGMLPGRVAGFYTDEECHINLCALAEFAGAQLYVDCVTGLDLANRKIFCDRHPPVAFDVLSIDIGSTPALPDGLQLSSSILPAKPTRAFLDQWDDLIDHISKQPELPIRLVIVGGGAGGVELAFTMQHRIQQILQAANQPLTNLELHLIHRGSQLLPRSGQWISTYARSLLTQRNIRIHLNEAVETVETHTIRCKSGLELTCDAIVWVTQASAPDWLSKAGLAVDDRGFVQVSDTLQSTSHPFVFAVGDVADMINHPRPKAGVFAVRQGKPLCQNLRRFLQNQSLKPFHPQKRYLSLINTADGQALAMRGSLGWRSPLCWKWKDHLDRRFMERLNNLPEMKNRGWKIGDGRWGMGDRQKASSKEGGRQGIGGGNLEAQGFEQAGGVKNISVMHCAGCGSKVGSTILDLVLQRIQSDFPPSPIPHPPTPNPHSPTIQIGLNHPDDAAVIQVPANKVLVQTIDAFTALIHDPFVFGQISANHALSDVYAMGAMPHSALAIATIPYGAESKVEESLYQLLSGAMKVLHEAGAVLIGGHTTVGTELAFGLSCNGFAEPDQLLRKGGMQPGQALILTKPLGTGTLFAAKMRYQVLGRWIDQSVESMLRSNQQAAHCFLHHKATACTDITGFGLVGHLLEMVRASKVAVTLDLDAVPVLDGALAMLDRGIFSSLRSQNLQASQWIDNLSTVNHLPKLQLLFDPQTAGGLLAAVPIEQETACLAALKALGYAQCATIAHTEPLIAGKQPITIA